jgi:Terminase large subunit, T4likevirus-type, N-terminal
MATVAHDWALAADPVRFSRAAGIAPDPWQADVLRSTAPRIALACSRQSGKSTTVATLAAHVATYQESSLTLVVSPTERQSAETLLKVRQVLTAVGWPVPPEAEGVTHLEFANASRVLALPGHSEATIRGFSGADLVIFDEAARCADSLYFSVSPMVAVSGGRLILLSSPYGRRGFYSDLWHSSEPWQRITITADECPRIPRSYLEEQRRSMGDWWFQQEFYARFLDPETSVFHSADIERMFSKGVETWDL